MKWFYSKTGHIKDKIFFLTFFEKLFSLMVVLCLSVSLLSGCARVRRYIAYTIYPIGWLVQRIGGSHYETISIQNGSTLLQDGTIRSDYARILSNSRVLFHLGDCEPYMRVHLNEILDNEVEEKDLSILNAVYNFGRYSRTRKNGTVVWDETDYYDGPLFQDVDHDTKDLYIWLDPVSMLAMAGDICTWMKTDNPDASDDFNQNYALLKEDLIELDAEYQQLADELWNANKKISFAAISVSFGCWQKAYGIGVYPLMLSKYGVLPNEAQLQAIEERIQNDHVTLIAHETNLNDAEQVLYDKVKEDCGLTEIELSNLSSESSDEERSGKDYLSLMYDNLQVLRQSAEAEQ